MHANGKKTAVVRREQVARAAQADSQCAFREVALDKSSTYLAHINVSKVEIDQILFSAGVGKVQQKIRICEENETPFRLCILAFWSSLC